MILFSASLGGFADTTALVDSALFAAINTGETELITGVGRHGQNVLRVTTPNIGDARFLPIRPSNNTGPTNGPSSNDLIRFAAWIRLAGGAHALAGPLVLFGTNAFLTANLGINANGQLRVFAWNDGAGSALATETANPGYLATHAGQFVHLEVAVKVHDSEGVWQVWLDGNLVIDFSGDTQAAGTKGSVWSGVGLCCPQVSEGAYVDWQSLLCWDDSVSGGLFTELTGGPYGPHELEYVPMSADSTPQDFSLTGAASHWQAVLTADGDTSFVQSTAAAQREMFAHSGISLISEPTHVITHMRSKGNATNTKRFLVGLGGNLMSGNARNHAGAGGSYHWFRQAFAEFADVPPPVGG